MYLEVPTVHMEHRNSLYALPKREYTRPGKWIGTAT